MNSHSKGGCVEILVVEESATQREQLAGC